MFSTTKKDAEIFAIFKLRIKNKLVIRYYKLVLMPVSAVSFGKNLSSNLREVKFKFEPVQSKDQ